MSHDDRDIHRLLRAARRAEPDDATLERVWQRVQAPPPIDPGPDEALDVPDPAALATATRTIAGKLAFAGGLKAIAATVLVAGAIVGGARWIADDEGQSIAAPPAPIAAPPEAAPAPPTGARAAEPAVEPPPRHRAPARAGKPDLSATDALAQERRLLADAQAALQRRDLAEAHARLDEHARRFARGALADEREVLRVLVLCDADRRPEALATAQALLETSGAGLFLARLRGSCIGERLAPVDADRP